MARTDTLGHFLTDVADAIRTKTGSSDTIVAEDFDTEIENIPSGGGDYNVKVDTSKTYDSYRGIGSLITEVNITGTNNMTNMSAMFKSCSNLLTISSLNTSSATNMSEMFRGCSSLTTIPLLDTSNVTNMYYMFNSCYALTTVPLLNTSKVTDMYNMFYGDYQLTDTSLDNILQMCINATLYTTKTLSGLGFESTYYPASRIQALPHYQDFIDAGWTIGY